MIPLLCKGLAGAFALQMHLLMGVGILTEDGIPQKASPAALRTAKNAMYKALQKFAEKFDILKFKDRIQEPLANGYRDILMNIKTSNGHIVEFRLHLAAMDEAAKYTHILYEEIRSLEAIQEVSILTDKEIQRIIELNKKATELHIEAWKKIK